MSAERDKNILCGAGIFGLGFISGVGFLIWVLNRNIPENTSEEAVVEKPGKATSGRKSSKTKPDEST